MKEALTLVMLVLLIAPVLLGVRRVRRMLDQAAKSAAKPRPTDDDSGPA
ncbi:hypothetical protein [Sphingosinicella terrae]|nr:hypothetical protein [Sphingosinicella terrae]